MSKISLEPNASGAGTFSIVSPDSNTNRTLNLPDEAGTILSDASIIDSNNLQSDVYKQNNILGTVSQSGGVPTGAVIESDSNSDGEFTRWADGTQSVVTEIALDLTTLSEQRYGASNHDIAVRTVGLRSHSFSLENQFPSHIDRQILAGHTYLRDRGSSHIIFQAFDHSSLGFVTGTRTVTVRVHTIGRWF